MSSILRLRAWIGFTHAEAPEAVQKRRVRRREGRVGDLAAPVGDERETPLRDGLGVELLERPGGGVAGIHEGVEFVGLALGVDAIELFEGHVDLAADFEHGGGVAVEEERDGPDGAGVLGDVVAADPVAAREGEGEVPLLPPDADGDAVDFRVADQPRRFVHEQSRVAAQPPQDAGVPLAQFRLVVGVVDGEHGLGVRDGPEALDRLAPDPLGGAVRVGEFGVGGLEVGEFAEEAVELGVRHDGSRVDVVRAVGAFEEVSKFRGSAHRVASAHAAIVLARRRSACAPRMLRA